MSWSSKERITKVFAALETTTEKEEVYIFEVGREKSTLHFKKKTEYQKIGVGVKGVTYTLNKKKYTDIESLNGGPMDEIMKDVYLCEDVYGNKILYCYTSIPTFDSADREWDSMSGEYLIFDGKYVNLVVSRGGYRLAKLTVYEQLLSADAALKTYVEKLGYQSDTINWM